MSPTELNLCVALIICISTASGMLKGEDAEKGQFPYMANMYLRELSIPFVSGAIIADRWILSIAYRLEEHASDPSRLTVYLGAWKFDEDAVTTDIAEIKLHPNWYLGYKRNDISLIKTVDRIVYSDYIKPISLPVADFPNKNNILAVMSGFGSPLHPDEAHEILSRSRILQYQATKTLTVEECKSQYVKMNSDKLQWANPLYNGIRDIDQEFICTTNEDGKGMCLGDIGNPLVTANTLVGLSSWGVYCNSKYPNVYTKVYTHIKWIKKVIRH